MPMKLRGRCFKPLSVDNIIVKKNEESMSSLKDAQHVLKNDQSLSGDKLLSLLRTRT